jgi:hypothetical protein
MSWFSSLYLKWHDRADTAWKPTGYLYRFTGHDETKAGRAITRAAIEQQQRRLLARKRGEPNPPKVRLKARAPNVVTIRRQA